MYRNYEILKANRENVNNNIGMYKIFGKSLKVYLIQSRRYRAI